MNDKSVQQVCQGLFCSAVVQEGKAEPRFVE